ncbi:Bug family tripartite tricarboxylate transporter substrate binding protein [Paracoccus litorisediminis]|uniref:Tripartite tricarboxylate transporter substrate binding protein n=1 Tax=Paracoccus litorisediminis TaxID=2006130 RepID=A0A844HUK0_9RHOB|nr:tripartite tricarboxylate transporter substrate binding protein [Paracoccus litorisediminis]MTH62017.1 tripartite tricarboxylate transporter substrate binding protein [Paracoccus litorisediminis]
MTRKLFETTLLGTGAAALMGLLCQPALAAETDYPQRPVHLVIGFAAGGGTDVFVRLLAPYLSKELGQPVVVENPTGANGNLATEAVASATPDGHTLLISTNSVMGSGPHVYPDQPVDPIEDLAHVTMLVESPYYVIASKDSHWSSFDDLVTAAKADPGKLVFGSQGVGSMGDIVAGVLELETGIDLNIVQYRGGGAVATDILSNQAQVTNFSSQMMDSYYASGQVDGLLVMSPDRNGATPDIPSAGELGYQDLSRLSYWTGLHAPKDTPPEVIEKLHHAVADALADPDLAARIKATGQTPVASNPDAFEGRVRQDHQFYGDILTRIGFQPE